MLFFYIAKITVYHLEQPCHFCGSYFHPGKICKSSNPANIYLFKVNNRESRKKCEICSKLTINTLKPHQ